MTSILGGVSLAVLGAGTAVFLIARANLRAQFDDALLDRAATLGSLVTDEDGALEFEYDRPLHEAEIGALARITSDDGRVIAQSPGWPLPEAPQPQTGSPAPALRALRLPDGAGARLARVVRRAVKEPVASGGSEFSDRTVVVEVIGRTGPTRRAEAAILAAVTLGGGLAALGSSLAVWLGVRRGLVPLRRLGAAVDGVDADTLALARGAYPEELAPIVRAIESLLERLRGAMARERRFTDAAAHELRTPLAELKTITEVADRWPEPQRLRRAVQDVGSVVREMEELLESLLAVVRGDAQVASEQPAPVALLPLARALAGEAMRRLGRNDLSWSFEGDEAGAWCGPPGVIGAIVRNVIDNAAEYTPGGGAVRVVVSGAEASAALEIESGPVAIEPAEVERIFEPFWRADSSRSDPAHGGLGLAIVDALARAMKLRREALITGAGLLVVRLGP